MNIRSLARPRRKRWSEPKTKPVSPQWRVAESALTLNLKQRSWSTERWIAEIEASLARHPAFGEPPSTPIPGELSEIVASLVWYHTIELPGGIVTQGFFDHRPLVPFYGIPDSLDGKRVLDVGTWDGFWAFEFERRGADVTAVDIEGLAEVDLPLAYRTALERSGLKQYYGRGFGVVREALGSEVTRVQRSVYDLDRDALGTFDLVHMGDLLLHLECPTRALKRIRSVTEGYALITNPFDPELSNDEVRYRGGWQDVVWWSTSLEALAQMILDSGFSNVSVQAAYKGRSTSTTSPDEWYWWAVLRCEP